MFKENLYSIRKARKITQATLGKKLKVSSATVGHWESGYSEPSVENIKKLVKLLKTTYDELLR